MIKSNELRLGNWVYNTHNIPMVVKTIGMDYIYVDFKNNPGDLLEFNTYNPFKPIPITEEILLKCGFEFSHFHGDERVFTNEYFIVYVNTYDNNIVKFGGVNLKSLHQLQNLYFALTQQELKIEL